MTAATEGVPVEQDGPSWSQYAVSPAQSDSTCASPQTPTTASEEGDLSDITALTELSLPGEEYADHGSSLAATATQQSSSPVVRNLEQRPDTSAILEVRKEAIQAMLDSRCADFVVTLKSLGLFIELRPGWVEERVAKMKATWRNQYLHQLDHTVDSKAIEQGRLNALQHAPDCVQEGRREL